MHFSYTGAVSFALILLMLVAPVTAEEVRRNDAALALIQCPWQQLHYSIMFESPRPGLRAMIFQGVHKIEVYARPSDDSRRVAYDIAHELGHAIDLTFNTDATRRKWMTLRGINPQTEWFGCDRCTDFGTPAGDFAETFAFLLLGPGNYYSRMAPPPTAEQIPALKPFFSVLQ
jgi:hypothetical protein